MSKVSDSIQSHLASLGGFPMRNLRSGGEIQGRIVPPDRKSLDLARKAFAKGFTRKLLSRTSPTRESTVSSKSASPPVADITQRVSSRSSLGLPMPAGNPKRHTKSIAGLFGLLNEDKSS